MESVAIFGIYRSRTDAERAVDNLHARGFQPALVSILMTDTAATKLAVAREQGMSPKAAQKVSGSLSWLSDVGALAIPGLGRVIAAGPIVGAILGAGAHAVRGALIRLGMSEEDAARYETMVRAGDILLAIHSDDGISTQRARAVLEATGAKSITSSSHALDHERWPHHSTPL